MAIKVLIDYNSIKLSDYVSIEELKDMLQNIPSDELGNAVHNKYQSIIKQLLEGIAEEIVMGLHDKVFPELSDMLEKAGEELGMESEDE